MCYLRGSGRGSAGERRLVNPNLMEQPPLDIKDRMAFVLTEKLLRFVEESGATRQEALAALAATQALLVETTNCRDNHHTILA